MVLHGDVKDHSGAVRVLRPAEDLLIVREIADVVPDVLGVLHVFLKVYLIKAKPGVDGSPVPAGGEIGMEGDGAVAQVLRLGDERRAALVEIELVRHGGGGQEGQGISGEILKLHVGGAAAGDGGDHGAFDGVLRQGVVEGQGVLRELQVGEGGGQVREGLIHDENEVFRQFPGGVHGLGGIGAGGLGHLVGVVVLRLGDKAVADGGGEVQQKAVLLGPPLLGVDADAGQQRRKEEGKEIDHHPCDAAPEELPSQALAPSGMVDDMGQQQEQEIASQDG